MGIKVAIDAGHGSQTAGKRTPDGYREHWINVKTAYACEQYLKLRGIETVRIAWNDTNATDDTDVSLTTRQSLIKNAGCKYSISCHANAHGNGAEFTSAEGVDTFYHSDASKVGDSVKLAECIQKEIIKGTTQKNRGYKGANFAMCNCKAMGTIASVLVEIGFMTNAREAELMKAEAFCREQGEDIARGFINYLIAKGEYNVANNASNPTPVETKPNISTSNPISNPTSQSLKISSPTVKKIQEYLNTYYGNDIQRVIGAKLVADNIYGAKTKRAIAIAIQTELNKLGAGLAVDGLFGNASASAYNKHIYQIKQGTRGIFVTLWQCYLVCNKLDPKGVDGICGAGCIAATNELLKRNGLPQDSVVNGSDLNKLL